MKYLMYDEIKNKGVPKERELAAVLEFIKDNPKQEYWQLKKKNDKLKNSKNSSFRQNLRRFRWKKET
jgi:hypothetical protein